MASIDRQLATIRKIKDIQPIEGADAIEVATVDGWKVVVKKNEFKKGDLVIYFEIDSWVPYNVAPFLSKGKAPKEYKGVLGNRLKTVRLRGQLSQGLVLPIEIDCGLVVEEGDDVTEILGIQKWEPPANPQLAGLTRGNFPSEIPRTDQQRIQNLSKQFNKLVNENEHWEVTEKLHGSSATFYLKSDGEFVVCSRNINLKEDDNNLYWKIARELRVEEKLKEYFLDYNTYNTYDRYTPVAIQGEIIGEGINGNQYGIKGQDFYVFDIYLPELNRYADPVVRKAIIEQLRLKHVPFLCSTEFNEFESIEQLLELAKGKSVLNDSIREGFVFKKYNQQSTPTVTSFKVINNDWLEKVGD
jgi:RNA ligase (TIGR02306 family)